MLLGRWSTSRTSGGAWATDIVVVDGDVYTSGTSENFEACYWIIRQDMIFPEREVKQRL